MPSHDDDSLSFPSHHDELLEMHRETQRQIALLRKALDQWFLTAGFVLLMWWIFR